MSRMSARRRPPLSEIDARRIVLIKPSALGDIVHSLPVLTALRQRFPHSHISWVVNRGYAACCAAIPTSMRCWCSTAARPGRLVAAARAFARSWPTSCAGCGLDLVVDLQGLFRTGLWPWPAGRRGASA